jgi:phosphopentomutase
MEITEKYLEKDWGGICFTNLVDFDMIYGHRRDRDGYAKAISEFDRWLGGFIKKMSDDDIIIITADHGCDPDFKGTDHTREYTPLLVLGDGIKPTCLGTRKSFADIAATAAEAFGVRADIAGESFLADITEVRYE